MDGNSVLFAPEAEAYVEALEVFDVKDIGNPRWNQQHDYIEKLNMQAVLNASQQEDEFVKEFLITHEKIPLLIHELIATETWKHKIFTEFIALNLEPKVMFPVYLVLYHEATLANLLETVFFHKETAESAEDSILDLADYCYRKLSQMIARHSSEKEEEEEDEVVDVKETENLSSLKELEQQNRKLEFDICVKAVSILRYITDQLPSLSFSLTTQLLNTQDAPILLVQLVETSPWTRQRAGRLQKYVDTKWQDVPETDRYTLSKIEGQVWLALYQLLMSEDCQRKYQMDSYRKNVLLKLRSYLTEVTLDQVPVLGHLRRYLEQLSLMDPPPMKQDLVLEQLPEIREHFMRANDGKWRDIARKQHKTFFNPSKLELKQHAKKLADTYSLDVLESLITEPPKCAVCGETATKRCSRCQNEWYCRRECQVGHWKRHKKACDLLVDSVAVVKEPNEEKAS